MVDEVSGPRAAPGHVLAALEALHRQVGVDLQRLLPTDMRGLRGSHGRILDLIADTGTRPTSLADGTWISKQAVGERVRELEVLGYVTTSTDPVDRRAVVVRRTALGDRVRRATRRAIDDMEHGWSEAVGPERYATFRAVLEELGARRVSTSEELP